MDQNNLSNNDGNKIQSHPATQNAPEKSKKVWYILVSTILLIIAASVVAGYYFIKPESTNITQNDSQTQTTYDQEIAPKAGNALYKDMDRALAFEYLKDLFLTDKSAGKTRWPVITFEKPDLNVNFSQGSSVTLPLDTNSCPIDCIAFSAFLADSNSYTTGGYKEIVGGQGSFPKFISPAYIYQDETGSKTFKLNGLNATHFYAAGDIGETIEDRVYVTDSKVPSRIIYIVYREHVKSKQRLDSKALSGSMIKNLFDSQKYATYQALLSSIKTLPVYLNQLAVASSEELGISFKYPKYWGDFQAQSYTGALESPGLQGINLSFSSPLYAGQDPSGIRLEAHNKNSAAYVYEGPAQVWQYYGQSLDVACQNKAYLDPSNENQVKINECKLQTLPNSFKLVQFKGSLIYAPGLGDDPNVGKTTYFKGAILQTKSQKEPGMTIRFESMNSNFSDMEQVFDKIINSLAYIK